MFVTVRFDSASRVLSKILALWRSGRWRYRQCAGHKNQCGMLNVTSSCANRIDVVGLDSSAEIAVGRAADGADASFCNRPKC